MKLAKGTIALVADGSRVLLLRNDGDHLRPELTVVSHQTIDTMANRELMSGAPGINRGTGYPRSSTFDESDVHQHIEDRLAADAVKSLADAAKATPGPIVIAAPPHMLGVLRRHYDHGVTARLVAEIDRDLTKLPVSEIAQQLAEHAP